MTEGEVLHVTIYGEEFASREDRQPDVQDTVFSLRILDDEKQTEVAGLSSTAHSLHDSLLALVEHPAAVTHNHQQLAHAQVSAGAGTAAHEQLG